MKYCYTHENFLPAQNNRKITNIEDFKQIYKNIEKYR